MSAEMSVIRTLHRMLRQQADIQSQLDRGPRQIRASLMQLEAAKNAVEQTRGSIRQSKMDADRKQLQLREREARLVDLEVKLNQAKGNREYQSLKEQIAADTQANLVLSDEILETLESVDELEQSLVAWWKTKRMRRLSRRSFRTQSLSVCKRFRPIWSECRGS